MSAKSQDDPLPIEIYEVTSSDPSYPPQQVLQGNPLSQGWRTAQNALMPQSLTVRLGDGLAAVSSIQFVAHETYTPALVEVHVAAEEPANSWLRLGHVRVGENSSGTRARERKTFRYKTNAALVKFTVTQLLNNPENVTKQAGICSVVIRGITLAVPEVAGGQQPGNIPQSLLGAAPGQTLNRPPSALRSQDVTTLVHAQKGPVISAPAYGVLPGQAGAPSGATSQNPHVLKADQLKTEIQLLKTKAVESADYLGAERYKVAHRKLSELQNTLEQLELRKSVAIQKEDFVTANTMKEAALQIQALIDTPSLPALVALLNGEKPAEPPKEVRQVAPVTAASNTIAVAQTTDSAQAPIQNSAEGVASPQYQGDDLSNAVPVIRQEEAVDNPDERALNVKAQGGSKNAFELTEEEKAQLAAEARARAIAFQKKKERGIRKKAGADVEEEEEAPAAAQRTAPGAEVPAATPGGVSWPTGPAWPVIETPYDFPAEIQALTQQFEGEGGPAELGLQDAHGPEASVLRAAGFTEVAVRLLASKQLDHCVSALAALEAALRADPAGRSEAAAAAAALLGRNVNAALLGYAARTFYFAYLGICAKYATALPDLVAVDFREIPGVDQSVEGIQLAEMAVFFKGAPADLSAIITTGIGRQTNIFAQEVLNLVAPLLARLQAQQKRSRTTAVNVLATLAGFPAFPIQNLFSAIAKKANIDRYCGLRPEDQKLSNQKYMAIIEARVCALAAIFRPNYDLAAVCEAGFLELIQWVLPHATRAELKRAILELAVLLYEGAESPNQLVQAVSKAAAKAPAVLKTVQQKFEASDAARGVEPRTKYVERDGAARLVLMEAAPGEQQIQLGDGFVQNQCQFCLYEAKSGDDLRGHLLRECRCCAVCPACHLVVEVPVLPEHLVQECSGRQNYAYKLAQCPKCQCVYEEGALAEHMRQCAVKLTGDACVCPLCSASLPDTEAALDHYAEGKCEANPRANAKLRALIDQKLAAKG